MPPTAGPTGGPASVPAPGGPEGFERRRLRVTGTVQGVGFRPFVYRHAVRLGLTGFVRNDSTGVLIEVEGTSSAVAELARVLVDSAPPLARVVGVSTENVVVLDPVGARSSGAGSPYPAGVGEGEGAPGFVIAASDEDGVADVPVSVDTATCAECLAEVDDPDNRRYGYPFTNCTNCGPRYTIVKSVPYDRPATTMVGFPMCPSCRLEYEDPADRRFHAQPNACPDCGPRLWLSGLKRTGPAGADAVAEAGAALRRGAILGVKGIGGYHLAVDATAAGPVAELRRRKARDAKPFAVMVRDVEAAQKLVELSSDALALLGSPRRPIVLARRRHDDLIAPGVAPGLAELGVMLPYSPLHHLLMAAVDRPLVLTSGNLSDEPIAYVDPEAADRLGPLVDGLLTHDRPIHIRCDDSVVRAGPAGHQVLRRSRGYAPEPMTLPDRALRPLLAVGAELKNTVAVAKGDAVVASHHLGDLEHLATYQSFLEAIEHLCHLCGVVPELVAHDLHPEYLSTKLAVELDLPTLAVQHHHAHVASCLVDHGRRGPVLGVAFDGLGFGTDGTLWGGEFLVADLRGFRRVGHLAPVPLPGGAAAIRQPWRMAVAWTLRSCGTAAAVEVGGRLDPRAAALARLLEGAALTRDDGFAPAPSHGGDSRGPGIMPTTTSVGRLFDAVAALVCGRSEVSYEGQAAIELEALGSRIPPGGVEAYPTELSKGAAPLILDPAPMLRAVVADLEAGRPADSVAAAFHEGLAAATATAASGLAREHRLDTVALTGGVFQNARLSALVESQLRESGLEVLVHRGVPPNDGGISIGQAAIAAGVDPGTAGPEAGAQAHGSIRCTSPNSCHK